MYNGKQVRKNNQIILKVVVAQLINKKHKMIEIPFLEEELGYYGKYHILIIEPRRVCIQTMWLI